MELPPALEPFPELTLPFSEPIEFTVLDDRISIQQFVQEQHSMTALGRRPQATPAGPNSTLHFVATSLNPYPLSHTPLDPCG